MLCFSKKEPLIIYDAIIILKRGLISQESIGTLGTLRAIEVSGEILLIKESSRCLNLPAGRLP
jgi:hypothetical protein